jgi:hypothetical protein
MTDQMFNSIMGLVIVVCACLAIAILRNNNPWDC